MEVDDELAVMLAVLLVEEKNGNIDFSPILIRKYFENPLASFFTSFPDLVEDDRHSFI